MTCWTRWKRRLSDSLLDGDLRRCIEATVLLFNPWLRCYEQPAAEMEIFQLEEKKGDKKAN